MSGKIFFCLVELMFFPVFKGRFKLGFAVVYSTTKEGSLLQLCQLCQCCSLYNVVMFVV